MLVAGEPSGDALGAELIAALHTLTAGSVKIIGVGGPLMESQGFSSLYGLEDTAVMGLREVVPKIPKIIRRVREARDFALKERPDATVLIDSPDFTNRVAAAIRKRDPSLKLVKYVAPQVWASRSYRAKQMAAYFDHVLCLLPFEPEFFEKAGLASTFVGHPVIERAKMMRGGAHFRAKYGVFPEQKLLLVLPGSRSSEIRFILPVMRETVAALSREVPRLVTVLPTVAHVAPKVRAATANWPTPLHLVEDEQTKFQAFSAADVALAASGTVTTELALARTPMVVTYKIGALTAAIARYFINVRYFTLINLILDRPAVPELMQHDCTVEKLLPALRQLLTDEAARAAQIAAFDEVALALGQGGERPSLRAGRALLSIVAGHRPKLMGPLDYSALQNERDQRAV
jgi:lipid-A-disaccharide synthase